MEWVREKFLKDARADRGQAGVRGDPCFGGGSVHVCEANRYCFPPPLGPVTAPQGPDPGDW